MEVKDIQGNILIDALVTEQAVKVDELMKQHSITLSWVSVTDDELPLGAYIEHEGVRYSLLAPYRPEQSDEATYAYKPVFEHPIMRWQYIPFFFYTYSEGKVVSKELDWNLTDNPANFMKAVCDAILNETGEDWSYEISADLPASASQSFSNTDIFSALNAIAGAFETEWWFDYANKIVYLSKAAYGDAVTLEVGQNIGVPSKNQSKDGYYTRFYAFGSTRNIEQNYAGSNVNSIVNKRLTLNPAKYPNGYIDIREGLTESEILVKTLVFDDIYPRSSLAIADVKVRLMWRLDSDKKKVQIGTDSNGNPVYDQYAIWYFKVPELQFDKDSIISGKPLSVHFNSGALNGREFELTYHDTEEDVETSDGTSIHVEKGDFEINFIEEGTFIIPAISGLVPNDGDEITLFNIKMPEEYKTSAYNDLEEAVLKEIAKQDVDNNNYTFESDKEAFYESNPNLTVGRKVLYKNGNSVLETRVIKLETQLDYAFEQKITIGNEQIKGNTQTLKEEVVNANQNIDLISAINESTQQLVQSYQRTQKALLDSMAKWGDMWSLDAIKGIVRTRYNIVSEQEVISNRRATGAGSGTGSGYGRLDNWAEWDADTMMTYVLSAKLGVSLNERLKNIEQNGSGLKEDDLKKYLDDNKYLQEGDITELKATVDGLDDLLNGGTKEVIDTWNEVVSFLDGYKDSEDLATILSGMNTDIANRVLIEDFEKLEEAVLAIDISGLSKRLDVAEQAIKTNATAIATNATNITNLNNRVKTLEDLGLTLEGDAETGYYIKSVYSFVSQGEIISCRRASGSGSGGGGGISEITAQMVVDALGYVPYSSLNPAGYITSAALSGYATETWVSDKYQPKGNYLLSVAWGDVSGKPSFATVATSGKYSDLSGVPIIPTDTNQLNNSAGYITSSALNGYATENWVSNNYQPKGNYLTSVAWGDVSGKPTTLGGYGITDALSISGGTITGQVYIVMDRPEIDFYKGSGNSAAIMGYRDGVGAWLYNDKSGSYLNVTDSGIGTFNGNTLIHSGNIGSYNAGSATKLQTARHIFGQLFDGTQNVSGVLSQINQVSFDETCSYGIFRGDWISAALTRTDLAFYAPRFHFSTGNVLIGTTEDNGYKLQVDGTVSILNKSGYSDLFFNINNSNGTRYLLSGRGNTGNFALLYNNGSTWSEFIDITNKGNVGIGTTSPATLLDVRGEVSVSYAPSGGLRLYNQDRNNWSWIGNSVTTGSDRADLVFADAKGVAMRITDGNVLIGTTEGSRGMLQVAEDITILPQGSGYADIRFMMDKTQQECYVLSARGGESGKPLKMYYSPSAKSNVYNELMSISTEGAMQIAKTLTIVSDAAYNNSDEGGELILMPASAGNYVAHLDVYINKFRVWSEHKTTGATAAPLSLDMSTGDLIVTGELISSRRATSSDARLKDNINRLIAKDCLEMVRNLQPSSWDWKENGEHAMGFIAQDVEQYMPYAVTKIKDEELGQRLNLQYDQFFAPVVGAIQCLDSEVEQLKGRVKYLENKLQEYGYNRY